MTAVARVWLSSGLSAGTLVMSGTSKVCWPCLACLLEKLREVYTPKEGNIIWLLPFRAFYPHSVCHLARRKWKCAWSQCDRLRKVWWQWWSIWAVVSLGWWLWCSKLDTGNVHCSAAIWNLTAGDSCRGHLRYKNRIGAMGNMEKDGWIQGRCNPHHPKACFFMGLFRWSGL